MRIWCFPTALAKYPSIYHVDHAEAVKGRIEYQLLDLSTDAERLKKKMLVGEVLPQIAVGAGYTCNTLMDKFKTNGLVFATLSIPISDWWEKSYDLKKQELNCTKAENQRRDLDEQMLLQMQLYLHLILLKIILFQKH